MAGKKKTTKGCGFIVGGLISLVVIASLFTAKDKPINAASSPTIETRESETDVQPSKISKPAPALTVALKAVKEAPITASVAEVTVAREEGPFKPEAPDYKPKPAALSALIPTPSRKWTNPEGKTVLGIVTAFDAIAETTTLRTAGGEVLEGFPLSKYNDADSQYLRDTAKGILSGRVVGVHDGDSITLLVAGNTQFKIRLEAIDAPELGQEYGNNAKTELGEMIYGKDVAVHVTGLDKYERVLGFVWLTDTLINQAMIERGLAWHFKEYSNDEKLAQAELAARDGKSGLWRDFKPMPPWEWRDLQKANAVAKSAPSISNVQPFVSTPSVPSTSSVNKEKPAAGFWLNTSGGKRHNASCRWYGNTKRGRYCTKSEGSACGICGG